MRIGFQLPYGMILLKKSVPVQTGQVQKVADNKEEIAMANILKHIKLDMKSTLESGTTLLIDKPRVYENYDEGVKQGPAGLAYLCLCEGLNFEKLTIKVPGSTVPQVEYEDEPVPVTFEGLEGKLWQDFRNGGEVKLSVTAKGVTPVGEKHLKMNKESKA